MSELLTCARIGCTEQFPPTVRRGNRGGRPRRFCCNACAVARDKAKRGGRAVIRARRTYPGESVSRFVATAMSPYSDRLGRPKTLYRFGATPAQAETRLFDLMDAVYDTLHDELVPA